MPTLNSAHKAFLVTELAMYGTPTEVAVAFKERFSIEISRDQVHTYDAGKERNRERMSAEHIKLFDETRAAWDKETKTLSIANKRWRLEKIQEMFEGTKPSAVRARMALLEQAAKEAGDVFTNRRELTGKDGAPLPTPPATAVVFDLSGLSDEELEAIEKLHGRHPSEPGHDSEGKGSA